MELPMCESDLVRPRLLQAALSHIELAVANMCVHADALGSQDRERLGGYAEHLKGLAQPSASSTLNVGINQREWHVSRFEEMSSLWGDQHTVAQDIECDNTMSTRKCLVADEHLAAVPPQNEAARVKDPEALNEIN